jgi:hypothetical protein
MSFIIVSTTSQRTTIVLKELDDWDEWILIIETMTKRESIERYVNLFKIDESIESIKSSTSFFATIKFDAENSDALFDEQRRDLIILRKDHKKKLRTYRKRIETLKNLNTFILTWVDWFNLIYLRDRKTIFQKLLVLKKRLASTNRIRKLEMIRKYKNLQRTSKHQQLDQ